MLGWAGVVSPGALPPRGRALPADAARLAADHAGVVGAVLSGRLALEVPRRAGHLAEVVRREGHVVVPPELERRPGLGALELDELVEVLLDEVREAFEDGDPVRQPEPAPARIAKGGMRRG